jgi:hypothetical protein
MEIYFLTPEQAYPRLQHLHINAGCTRPHYEAISVFSGKQRELLLHLMKQLNEILGAAGSARTPSAGKIEFVLLERGVYWDFPFTWGKTMIMITPKIFEKSNKSILKILTHEWVHLEQRRHPRKYHRFYRTLGFRKHHIDFQELGLSSHLLRNPDADQYEWIWQSPTGGPIYAPVALLKSCEFHTLLLRFNGMDRAPIIYRLKDVPLYYERFGVKKQLYHPNEITAHLIADMLVQGTVYPQIKGLSELIG